MLIDQIGVIIVIYPRRRLQREFRETLLQSPEQRAQHGIKMGRFVITDTIIIQVVPHLPCDLGKGLGLFNSGSRFPVERKEEGLYPCQEGRWKLNQGIYLPW